MRMLLIGFFGLITGPLAQAQHWLPYRNQVEYRLRSLEQQQFQLQQMLLQAQQQNWQTWQSIAARPPQTLPIEGMPRQELPIPGSPRQELPVPGLPRQELPPSGVPRQELPPQGSPRQFLPAEPTRPPSGPVSYVPALWKRPNP